VFVCLSVADAKCLVNLTAGVKLFSQSKFSPVTGDSDDCVSTCNFTICKVDNVSICMNIHELPWPGLLRPVCLLTPPTLASSSYQLRLHLTLLNVLHS